MKKLVIGLAVVGLVMSGCAWFPSSTGPSELALKETCAKYVDDARIMGATMTFQESTSNNIESRGQYEYKGTFYSKKLNTCVNIYDKSTVELGNRITRPWYGDALTGNPIEVFLIGQSRESYEKSLQLIK